MRIKITAVRALAVLGATLFFAGPAFSGWEDEIKRGRQSGYPEGFMKTDRLCTVNKPDGKPRTPAEVKGLTDAMKGYVKEYFTIRDKAAGELTELLRDQATDSAGKWARKCAERLTMLRQIRDNYRKALSAKEMDPLAYQVITEFLDGEVMQWSKTDSLGQTVIQMHDLLLRQVVLVHREADTLRARIDWFNQEAEDAGQILQDIGELFGKEWLPDEVQTVAMAVQFLGSVIQAAGRVADGGRRFHVLMANVSEDSKEIQEFARQYDAKKYMDEVLSINSREIFSGPASAYYAPFEKAWEAELINVAKIYTGAYEKYTAVVKNWTRDVVEPYDKTGDKFDRTTDTLEKLQEVVEKRKLELDKEEFEKAEEERRKGR